MIHEPAMLSGSNFLLFFSSFPYVSFFPRPLPPWWQKRCRGSRHHLFTQKEKEESDISSFLWRVRGLPSQKMEANFRSHLTDLNGAMCSLGVEIMWAQHFLHNFLLSHNGQKTKGSCEKDHSNHAICLEGHLLTPQTVSVTHLPFHCLLIFLLCW